MSTSTIKHQHAELAVTDIGQGRAVTFLHAGVADRRSWAAVMDIVAESRRAIAYDQRGYGETAYESEPYSHTADLMAVLDGLGVDSTVLVGCSRGGQVAFDAAVRHPDRIAALALIGSAPNGGPDASPPPPGVVELFKAINDADAANDLAALNELEARAWLDGPEAPPGRVRGEARELFLSMNGQALAAAEPGDSAPLAGWDKLDELRCPTLVMVGALDLPPLIERAKKMASILTNGDLIVLEDAAHLPMVEHPGIVASHLLEFLGRLA